MFDLTVEDTVRIYRQTAQRLADIGQIDGIYSRIGAEPLKLLLSVGPQTAMEYLRRTDLGRYGYLSSREFGLWLHPLASLPPDVRLTVVPLFPTARELVFFGLALKKLGIDNLSFWAGVNRKFHVLTEGKLQRRPLPWIEDVAREVRAHQAELYHVWAPDERGLWDILKAMLPGVEDI